MCFLPRPKSSRFYKRRITRSQQKNIGKAHGLPRSGDKPAMHLGGSTACHAKQKDKTTRRRKLTKRTNAP